MRRPAHRGSQGGRPAVVGRTDRRSVRAEKKEEARRKDVEPTASKRNAPAAACRRPCSAAQSNYHARPPSPSLRRKMVTSYSDAISSTSSPNLSTPKLNSDGDGVCCRRIRTCFPLEVPPNISRRPPDITMDILRPNIPPERPPTFP